jgi:arsenate reductase (thioredoxin)
VERLAQHGKPTVLFLCAHNAGRSQIVPGIFQHRAGDAAATWSAGSEPGRLLELLGGLGVMGHG